MACGGMCAIMHARRADVPVWTSVWTLDAGMLITLTLSRVTSPRLLVDTGDWRSSKLSSDLIHFASYSVGRAYHVLFFGEVGIPTPASRSTADSRESRVQIFWSQLSSIFPTADSLAGGVCSMYIHCMYAHKSPVLDSSSAVIYMNEAMSI